MTQETIVVGAGVGGLTTAIELARRGHPVTVLERADTVGGKMRREILGGRAIDAGPTVLTMRPIFEEIFEAAGARLTDHVRLTPVEILARHAWVDGSTLDLHADMDRMTEAIARFAGISDAHGYRRFCAYSERIHRHVKDTFLLAEKPSFTSILKAVGTIGMGALLQMDGYRTMWAALSDFFSDPRLLQLFGRYATYSGSSPFEAPATLNVIAHVERSGVWLVEGGMFSIAQALLRLATQLGVVVRTGAHVSEVIVESGAARGVLLTSGERMEARAVVMNADAGALAAGLFGSAAKRAASAPSPRSLSAMTWAMVAETRGFPLVRHNVFFSKDYGRENHQLFDHGQIPDEPTVYVCAQDRADSPLDQSGPERLLCLINAPADGDRRDHAPEKTRCERSMMGLLSRCGLTLLPTESPIVTTPSDFAKRFPATGGALYGAASHGWRSPFSRPAARSKISGLYLTGGSAHPGAGVPMVAQSGRLAAMAVHEDFVSSARSRTADTRGGMSMR